jgi:hypothetical protein
MLRREHTVSDLRIDYSVLADIAAAARSRRGRARARRRLRRLVRKLLRGLAVVTTLAVLPFVLLVGGAVLLYQSWGVGTWPSLLLALLATVGLLSLYAQAAGRRLRARRNVREWLVRGSAGVAAAYVVYALLFIASSNVKSPEVRTEYRALHPLLRVASSALILLDPASVVTDAARSGGDYARMGLPPEEASLHFRQRDGYVHALDLRTGGRSALRNVTIQLGFRALGFNTLRHGGTADHLHVSLAVTG